jgi:ATP-dependent helicase HrpA
MVATSAGDVDGYPDALTVNDMELPLTYRFAPGAGDDGVTARLPLATLNRIPAAALTWLVPSRRHELATALIKALPKDLRRALVPAPDTARAALQQITYDERVPFTEALRAALVRVAAVDVGQAWRAVALPTDLRLHLEIVDDHGELVARGDDIDELRVRLAPQLQRALASAAPTLTREGLQAWPGGRLPRTIEMETNGAIAVGYPALVDTGDSVAVRVLASADEQRQAMACGTRRLLLLTLPSPARAALDSLSAREKLALSRDTDGRPAEAVRDSISAAVDALVEHAGGPAWDEAAFARLRGHVGQRLAGRATEVLRLVADVHAIAHDLRLALSSEPPAVMRPSYDDMRAQLAALVPDNVATITGSTRLAHLPRYLEAMRQRLERLPRETAKDLTLMERVHAIEDAWHDALDAIPSSAPVPAPLGDVKWMIEELRVSLFAQRLGTAHPVSEKRILQVVHARA